MTPPERFKKQEALSVDEILEHRLTGTLPETDEYREARRQALQDAGLADEGDPPENDATDPQSHFDRRRGNR